MENKLAIFENEEFGRVRVIQEEDRFLFCALDAATALGYASPRAAIHRHCRCVAKRNVPHPQAADKMMEMTFIPEGDLYRLIVHSRLPTADKFEHWVFDEVLPCIRKHGAYMTDSMLEKFLQHPELIYQMAEMMLGERRERVRIQAELDEAKPKADYFDAFVNPLDCTNIRTTAKQIRVPEKKFTAVLQARKFMYRAPSGNLLPYAKESNRELFIVRDYYNHGHQGCYTLITPKGKELFLKMAEKMLG